jgi:hypothetical protein
MNRFDQPWRTGIIALFADFPVSRAERIGGTQNAATIAIPPR